MVYYICTIFWWQRDGMVRGYKNNKRHIYNLQVNVQEADFRIGMYLQVICCCSCLYRS